MYESLSSVYDRFVNWQSRLAYEMPFIEQQLQTLEKEKSKIRILDAACGTGMHVIELFQRGYNISGADVSKSMILKAIENAATFDVRTDFKAAGFGDYEKKFLNGNEVDRFDSILCLGNSIPHVLTRTDLDRALADFYQCLATGGFLLIQNRNFDAILAQRQRWMEPQSYRSDDGEWVFIRFYDFETDGVIRFNILTLHRKMNSDWQQGIESTHLYPWRSNDMEEALQTAGFNRITRFGDMTGNPYDPENSGNLVIRAEKAGD